MIQVQRITASTWTVTRVAPLARDVYDYEIIGRAVWDGDLWWAETAVHGEDGVTYRREGRGRLLRRVAVSDLIARAEASPS